MQLPQQSDFMQTMQTGMYLNVYHDEVGIALEPDSKDKIIVSIPRAFVVADLSRLLISILTEESKYRFYALELESMTDDSAIFYGRLANAPENPNVERSFAFIGHLLRKDETLSKETILPIQVKVLADAETVVRSPQPNEYFEMVFDLGFGSPSPALVKTNPWFDEQSRTPAARFALLTKEQQEKEIKAFTSLAQNLELRADRLLVRQFIQSKVMKEEYEKSVEELGVAISHEAWLGSKIGANMQILAETAEVDALTDGAYILHLEDLATAEAKALYTKTTGIVLEERPDDTDLLDVWEKKEEAFEAWAREQFKVERLEDLALPTLRREFPEIYQPEGDEENEDEDTTLVIGVTMPGTIFEKRANGALGPETPYALATLKRLVEAGHMVVLVTDTNPAVTERAEEIKQKLGFEFSAIQPLDADGCGNAVDIEMLIDHRAFGSSFVDLTKSQEHSTLFWGPVVEGLLEGFVLTQEDVDWITDHPSMFDE